MVVSYLPQAFEEERKLNTTKIKYRGKEKSLDLLAASMVLATTGEGLERRTGRGPCSATAARYDAPDGSGRRHAEDALGLLLQPDLFVPRLGENGQVKVMTSPVK